MKKFDKIMLITGVTSLVLMVGFSVASICMALSTSKSEIEAYIESDEFKELVDINSKEIFEALEAEGVSFESLENGGFEINADGVNVHIGADGIHVEDSEGGDIVDIGIGGIHVEDSDGGEVVDIGPGGIHVEEPTVRTNVVVDVA